MKALGTFTPQMSVLSTSSSGVDAAGAIRGNIAAHCPMVPVTR